MRQFIACGQAEVCELWLQEGQKGVEAQYMQSKEFHEAWKVQAREVLARAEFKKRKLTQRVSFHHILHWPLHLAFLLLYLLYAA